MRAFGFLGLLITAAIIMYLYSIQVQGNPGAAAGIPGGVTMEAPEIAGVKNDLLVIANAERGYFSVEGRYLSLNELISGNYVTMKTERPPYVYNVETGSSTFRVTATRTTKGSPAEMWITETMEVQSSN